MNLNDMIYRRKSCRSYTGVPVDAEMIEKILSFEMKPLYPEIKVRMDVVSRDQIKCILPWIPPQVITVYSEETDGYLENAGFLFQQMDLYLQSLGLGVCWLGMGKLNSKTAPEVEGMRFVIMLGFGHPDGDQLRSDRKEFKRKSLSQISDREDQRLEPARLAPSSINSQPWFFAHEEDAVHAFCAARVMAGYMNRIDMGIALSHLYLANPATFRLLKPETPPAKSGHKYICSFAL